MAQEPDGKRCRFSECRSDPQLVPTAWDAKSGIRRRMGFPLDGQEGKRKDGTPEEGRLTDS